MEREPQNLRDGVGWGWRWGGHLETLGFSRVESSLSGGRTALGFSHHRLSRVIWMTGRSLPHCHLKPSNGFEHSVLDALSVAGVNGSYI